MVAGKRADGRAYTHLDLGRLEGRDGAGERGGNAGHFCWVCFRWCSKNVCGNGADEASDAPFVTADSKRDQYHRGEIKYRALIGANRESPLITRKSRFCLGQLKA